MNVSATPMPVVRANSRSARAAPTRATPLPASTIGRSAARISPTASSSSAAARLRPPHARLHRQRLGVDRRGHHVLGQLDVRRPGLLRLCDLERLAHGLRDQRATTAGGRSTSSPAGTSR